MFFRGSREFYPFGALITMKGEINSIGVFLGEDDNLASQDVFKFLQDALKSKSNKGECHLAAIGMDVLITLKDGAKKDALRVTILTQENIAQQYFLYVKKFKDEYVFEEYTEMN